MSSANSEPPASKWPLWRRLMLAGGLILFANALAEAVMAPDPPRFIDVTATVVGFLLLASGFGQRFRSKNG